MLNGDGMLMVLLLYRFESWQADWTGSTTRIPLQRVQQAFIRFYGRVFRFQLDEVHLILAVSKGPEQTAKSLTAFRAAVQSALRVLLMLRNLLAHSLFLWESAFIGAASCSVWLASNASGMNADDRMTALEDLGRTQGALHAFAQGDEGSMAAYTSRLIAHWIKKVDPQPVDAKPAEGRAITTSLSSHFFDTQWTGLQNGQQQQAGMWTPEFGLQGTVGGVPDGAASETVFPFFNAIMPAGNEQDFMYPPLDDRLW